MNTNIVYTKAKLYSVSNSCRSCHSRLCIIKRNDNLKIVDICIQCNRESTFSNQLTYKKIGFVIFYEI
jgi:hypothetical protein